MLSNLFSRSSRLLQTRPASLHKRALTTSIPSKMRIVPVPVREDNYSYLLIDDATCTAAVVDPYNPEKVLAAAKSEGVTVGEWVITTHHHHDHSGGNEAFVKTVREAGVLASEGKEVVVFGGSEKGKGVNRIVKDGDTFKIGKNIDVRCIATPCHTQDSIAFYVEDKITSQRGVFTGDTLFVSGCGRFFEGTASEMHSSLSKLAGLPHDTVTYVGHEYTRSNAAFSASVEPENEDLKKLVATCEEKGVVTTGRYTVGDELKFNVFMRLTEPAVQKATGKTDEVEVMHALREMKNAFKG